jgi:hypothetical protein
MPRVSGAIYGRILVLRELAIHGGRRESSAGWQGKVKPSRRRTGVPQK